MSGNRSLWRRLVWDDDVDMVHPVKVIGLFLGFIFIGIPLFVTVPNITGIPVHQGTGTHVGYVTAIENTGLIWTKPTAYFKTDFESTQEDRYCVGYRDGPERDALYAALRGHAERRELVEVTFDDYFLTSIRHCISNVVIVSVRVVA